MVNPLEKTEMSTMAQCMAKLSAEGFTEIFTVTQTGLLVGDGTKYSPEEIKIVNFYRFEGESDPADSSILYAIETFDHRKGMISDAYGPYSDSKVTKLISQVEEISKKVHNSL